MARKTELKETEERTQRTFRLAGKQHLLEQDPLRQANVCLPGNRGPFVTSTAAAPSAPKTALPPRA